MKTLPSRLLTNAPFTPAASGPAPPSVKGRGKERLARRTLRMMASVSASASNAARLAERNAWLQRIDPRVKIIGLLLLLCVAGFAGHWATLAILGGLVSGAAVASRIPAKVIVKRAWLAALFFAGGIAFPSLFNWFYPGRPILPVFRFGAPVSIGPWEFPAVLAVTREGLWMAGRLILRVADSTVMALAVTLTTDWPGLLRASRALGMPKVFAATLEMGQRYIHLLLRAAADYWMARESRASGWRPGHEQRRALGHAAGFLFFRTHQLSEAVYLAMLSRGYTGEPAAFLRPWRGKDLLGISAALLAAIALLGGDWLLGR